MKKALVAALVVISVLAVSSASAQGKDGENIITAGLGLGYPGLYGTSSVPPIFVSFDHGIVNKFSVGGILAYSGSSYEVDPYKWSYTYIFVGARGGYHFAQDLKAPSNVDVYGGLTLGYNIVSSSLTGPGTNYFGYTAGGSYFQFGFYAGARYFFSPKFGASAEVGYDIGYFKVGVSYIL